MQHVWGESTGIYRVLMWKPEAKGATWKTKAQMGG